MQDRKRLLNDLGLKCTPARRLVLGALSASKLPLTAQKVYEQVHGSGINLSTVYRTLSSFEKYGLAKTEVNEKKESAYSLNDGRHTHVIVCVKCHKKVFLAECPYHEANEKISKETGYQVLDHNTELFGVCPSCLAKAKHSAVADPSKRKSS